MCRSPYNPNQEQNTALWEHLPDLAAVANARCLSESTHLRLHRRRHNVLELDRYESEQHESPTTLRRKRSPALHSGQNITSIDSYYAHLDDIMRICGILICN